MGYGTQEKDLFRDMEFTGGADSHQFQGITDGLIYTTPQRDIRAINNLNSGSEGQTVSIESNSDFSSKETSNMVPRNYLIINLPTAFDSCDNNNSRLKKRKISVNREQVMDNYYLEVLRSVLQEQGLSDLAIEIFVSNE
ncbi:hypothetical protein AYI70_g1861 [Smittium culicis]|uniref:Uncharacterized protein n=1 Tax=Smittium culicis TaxID=133412 RepID=A0A1R1YAR5_9FUNG|nr:hypothetical protein AYI70_g1861 [Smittium culicis]